MAYTGAKNASGELGDFRLYCRGEVRLYFSEEDCTPKSKKGRALLAVLAAEQRPLSRIKIIDLLWSERQEEQARASLRTLLADLKEQFNSRFEDLLVVDRERVGLGPGVRSDLVDPTLARPVGELFEGLDHIDPELDEWLRTERERWKKETPAPPASSGPSALYQGHAQAREPSPWVFLIVVILALAAGVLLYLRPWSTLSQPVVAVLKFKDMTGKYALLADGLAEELRIQLAQHPQIQVIGRESSEAESIRRDPRQATEKLGARFTVEGSIINRDGSPHVSVRLNRAATGTQLWSQLFVAEGAMMRAGSAAIAARLASNVNETVGQGSGAAFVADAKSYEQVFAARRAIRGGNVPDILEARSALKSVISKHPQFAPALAALAETSILASDHPFARGPITLPLARKEAETYARRAIAAAPEFGPGYTALGVAYFETPAALQPLQLAVEINPGSYEARYRLARALELAGDYQASLVHERVAAALEPLDVTANYQLLRMLRYTGHDNEIPDLIGRFTRRTDDIFKKFYFIAASALETGDISSGYAAARAMLRLQPRHEQARRLMMWFRIYIGDRTGASQLSSPDSVTAMILRDDLGSLIRKAKELGADFWSLDWETADASNYLVRRGRSDVLASLFESTRATSRGREPQISAIDSAVILALRRAGKNREADTLIADVERYVDRSGLPPGIAAWAKADLLLTRGRKEEALAKLEQAQRDNWWNLQSSVVPLEDRAAFHSVRNHPRFHAMIRNYYANIARERRELSAELRGSSKGPVDPELLISDHS